MNECPFVINGECDVPPCSGCMLPCYSSKSDCVGEGDTNENLIS